MSSHEDNYRLARQMQDLFREAIKAIMENKPTTLQEILQLLVNACQSTNIKKLINLKDHKGFSIFLNATISENDEMMK